MTDSKRVRMAVERDGFAKTIANAWLNEPMNQIPREIATTQRIRCDSCKAEMLLVARDFHARRCGRKRAA